MLKGIDISYYQGNVDFSAVRSQIDFVIIRSSYGVGYVDKMFETYRNQAREKGIPLGFYHYSYPQYNLPEEEAQWFLQTLGNVQEGDILCLDYEEKWNGNVVEWCKRFLDFLSLNLNGYKPLIYLNKSLILGHDWSPVVNSGYGLWVAHYDNDPNEVHFNTPWPTVALKQYTDKGLVTGISGNVDLNTFFGNLTALTSLGFKKPEPIVILEPQPSLPPANESKNEVFVNSLKDRKFLLTLFVSTMAFLNAKFNIANLNQTQFLFILAPFMAWLIAEGVVNIYVRAKVNS